MDYVQLPDEIKAMVEAQASAGRASGEAAFLRDAVLRHVAELEAEDAALLAAIDAGVADIEAGRFETIEGPDGFARLRAEMSDWLDELDRKAD